MSAVRLFRNQNELVTTVQGFQNTEKIMATYDLTDTGKKRGEIYLAMHDYFNQHSLNSGLDYCFDSLNPCQLIHLAIKLICYANCIECQHFHLLDLKAQSIPEEEEVQLVTDWKRVENLLDSVENNFSLFKKQQNIEGKEAFLKRAWQIRDATLDIQGQLLSLEPKKGNLSKQSKIWGAKKSVIAERIEALLPEIGGFIDQ